MAEQYYELPIRFKSLMKRNAAVSTCDLKKSIAQNIFLIITSKYKEHRYNESYGCALWDMDFELISNENRWLETVRKSIYNSVVKHERRLYDISVDVDITLDDTIATFSLAKSIKKRLSISIKGMVAETGEEFSFDTNIYLSPLSID